MLRQFLVSIAVSGCNIALRHKFQLRNGKPQAIGSNVTPPAA